VSVASSIWCILLLLVSVSVSWQGSGSAAEDDFGSGQGFEGLREMDGLLSLLLVALCVSC